ncbi:hypothetical protein ACHAXA_005246 [Cyclostephanos tholiformis]|uniref:HECT-type E3 ubiquitin transferase n=1 Tax=Cyclostephanos tholiformis TaxID=382380 RepID=A0ABD3R7S4_9STRA
MSPSRPTSKSTAQRSLHEHLHRELRTLISVIPQTDQDEVVVGPSRAKSTTSPTRPRDGGMPNTNDNKPPTHATAMLRNSRNEGRRRGKLDVGYSVLMWVRPTLHVAPPNGDDSRRPRRRRPRRPPRRQVLYRFATCLDDGDRGNNNGDNNSRASSVGVCAILGQWRAIEAPTTTEHVDDVGGIVSTMLTATWSLIAIQHTHPYLRRPELIVSVNGEEMMRGELGFPALDATTIAPPVSAVGDNAAGSVHYHHRGGKGTHPADEQERRRLRGMGILAECTLLDGPFDNGVEVESLVLDLPPPPPPTADATTPSLSKTTTAISTTKKWKKTFRSCTASVHSVALLAGPPIPNAALAIVAERGPLGDYTSSPADVGSRTGLSFLLGPVPPNPQNRDAVVAPSAGHGYYGTAVEGGSGGDDGGGRGGIMGSGTGTVGMASDELAPRSLGIPASVGITPGVYPGGGGLMSVPEQKNEDGVSPNLDTSITISGSSSEPYVESWIGSGEEHAAHVCLQGLLGRVVLTFHSADTKTYGGVVPSSPSASLSPMRGQPHPGTRRRMICLPSAAPSRIGGADAVPKVGIVRPTTPSPLTLSAGMEITGSATYINVTCNYINCERQRDPTIMIRPPSSAPDTTEYDLNDNPPISFPRAIQAANAMSLSLLPFRLALPHAGNEEVNDMQRKIHAESFTHLNDLLCNDGEFAGGLILLVTECIRCGGSAMRDEALQNGVIHVLATLVRKVLIRGARFGLLTSNYIVDATVSRLKSGKVSGLSGTINSSSENVDYDMDHDSTSPPIIPLVIANALVELMTVCCGPNIARAEHHLSPVIMNPCRGLLRVRRASDLALTAIFGLAMDLDLLGNDPIGAAPILKATASRYAVLDLTSMARGQSIFFAGEDYGSLLRKQINLQYFLDCLRIRLDHSLMYPKGLVSQGLVTSSTAIKYAIESVASSLSDILYTMLLSTLTSAAGVSVSRGERDIGALVGTLTECPLGSICAHVVTTSIARLLVDCGVMSNHCLRFSSSQPPNNQKRKGNCRQPDDIALESRLGRNLLLCHYHDIVAPLLLSRSSPRFSNQPKGCGSDDAREKSDLKSSQSINFHSHVDSENVHPLDWTYHWRLSLLNFTWLISLTGREESKSISTSTGHLILLAAKAGSLDKAMLGHQCDNKSGSDLLAVLSHFLVLSSSREQENSVTSTRVESISRRLSAFMPLIPGVAQSLLSPSIIRNDANSDQPEARMIITAETSLAVDMLKQILSMLNLAIQALYGSKRGGLLGAKSNAKGQDKLHRAKTIFVSGAQEYVPILLQIVSLVGEPIHWSKEHLNDKMQEEELSFGASPERRINNTTQPTEPILRNRTASTDKDWVDISSSTSDLPDVTATTPSIPSDDSAAKPLSKISSLPMHDTAASHSEKLVGAENLELRLAQCVHNDLTSVQDLALYAVSRLVAQAMMYGGGEASTAVWRSIISGCREVTNVHRTLTNEEDSNKSEMTLPKSTLCHLAGIVLSKFARHHNHRLETYRSPWNIETCSAVARLMDLVEEKELISQPEKTNRRGSIVTRDCYGSKKYSIDQVRLLHAILDLMASGRECGGWIQIKNSTSRLTLEEVGKTMLENQTVATPDTSRKNPVENSLPHSNYELYYQASSGKQDESGSRKSSDPSNSKLLLPILQSCIRTVVPATEIISSDAVVITDNTPSTSLLLKLVCAELEKSLVAAIQGLSFPISRDVFMNAVASFRRSIAHHKMMRDAKAAELCSTSVMTIVRAMCCRYVEESIRIDRVSFDAYEYDETALNHGEISVAKEEFLQAEKNAGNKEGLHAQVIERLILGENVLSENGADFVSFPGDVNLNDNSMKVMVSPMGWSHYKGLGAALNQCYREEATYQSPEEKAEFVLSILERYIDNWDKIQIIDAGEAELVDLFDESIHVGSTNKSPKEDLDALSIPLSASCTASLSASDAMTRFIEVQSILKHQHQYLAYKYFVRRRFGRTAFVERFCWNTWMDCTDPGISNCLWERAVNDGGRDFPSKIATVPVFPLFPRFIPSYLDHSPELIRSCSVSSASLDIKLLSQTVKIVDITKKEISEEMLEQLDRLNEAHVENAMADYDESEIVLHFTDRTGSKLSACNEAGNNQSTSAGVIDTETTLVKSDEETPMSPLAIQQGTIHFAASSFSYPPDSSSLHSMGEGRRLGGGSLEEYYSSCLHASLVSFILLLLRVVDHIYLKSSSPVIVWLIFLKCTLILTESHLIIEYDDGDMAEGELEPHHQKKQEDLSVEEVKKRDEEMHMRAAMRLKATRWNISEASHIYLRRYRLRDSALELFFIPSAGVTTGGTAFFAGSRSLFIDFGAGTWGNTRRDDAANAIMRRAPMQTVKQYPDKSGQFLHEELKKLTHAWRQDAISNFDYLLSLNILAGRSYNDICQYPVFPWVLSNYTSKEVPDLEDKANFRDMSKPMGALNEERLAELLDRFNTFDDPAIPPFMYGSHYSTSAGVVIHFLIRLHPFSSLHRQLQSGHFDVADRLFSSIKRTWDMCTGRSAAEVKELTPEFYSNPSFLRNSNEFKLGTSQDGEVLGDVLLPPWAKGSPEKFVEVMRLALESDICSKMLPDWIDLIFGRKQQGKAAIEANNVYFYLTYYGSVDVASIEDEGLRQATELQIAHFGQCPMQLFYRRHPKKQSRENHRRHQTLSDLYDMKNAPLSIQRSLDQIPSRFPDKEEEDTVSRKELPFMDAPLSYWVHLGAPPPGPHAPLVSIRLTSTDRCLAVDSRGVFHFFRWAWKPDFEDDDVSQADSGTSHDEETNEKRDIFRDKGCFVAQRELFSFRIIPRLPYASSGREKSGVATVAISKTMFANRSLILVVSDGDGKGALAMQLVDPIKGQIQGEVIVPSTHADRITAIDMDPIGTASGQGGVGGELVFVGSADGSATLWRFISSHYWPLRPRLRMWGHSGSSVYGVAISCSLGICASVSSKLCCLFDIGNGAMIRNFTPPDLKTDKGYETETTFANTQALCLSTLGFVIAVCSTKLTRGDNTTNEIFSLELFTVEGRHMCSRPLPSPMGTPKKIVSTADGRAVFVCAGGGASVYLVSSLRPLVTLDRWELSDDEQAVHDVDFWPTLARPVVAAAGCSSGALLLHALCGISKWSHEHQRNPVSSAVGSVLALPAQTVKNALGGVSSFGSSLFGSAKEISKEAFSVVKEREGGFFFRSKKKG